MSSADRALACAAVLRGLLSQQYPDGGDDYCAAVDAIDSALRRAPTFLEGRRLPSGGWQGSSSFSNGEEHAFMVRCLPVALLALAATGLLGNGLLLLIASLCGACMRAERRAEGRGTCCSEPCRPCLRSRCGTTEHVCTTPTLHARVLGLGCHRRRRGPHCLQHRAHAGGSHQVSVSCGCYAGGEAGSGPAATLR